MSRAHGIPPEVQQIFRNAVACRDCFTRLGLGLEAALIDVAQPRWIGEDYWDSALRTVIVLVNPASGKGAHDRANERFRRLIKSYDDRSATILPVFDHQKNEIPLWGNGKFWALYFGGFGLRFSETALANIAWCAEKTDRYPKTMLDNCFQRHTKPLLQSLEPKLIILSGSDVGSFAGRIKAACPAAKIETVLHYAHRKGDAATRTEIMRVKNVIAALRNR